MAETTLLEDLRDHLQPSLDMFPDTFPPVWRLHSFTDADLTSTPPVILLRRSGSGGDDDEIAQQTDVDVVLIVALIRSRPGRTLSTPSGSLSRVMPGWPGLGCTLILWSGPSLGRSNSRTGGIGSCSWSDASPKTSNH